MPEISRFYGIVIRMYGLDHAPPHMHAVYQDGTSRGPDRYRQHRGDPREPAGARSPDVSSSSAAENGPPEDELRDAFATGRRRHLSRPVARRLRRGSNDWTRQTASANMQWSSPTSPRHHEWIGAEVAIGEIADRRWRWNTVDKKPRRSFDERPCPGSATTPKCTSHGIHPPLTSTSCRRTAT